MRCSSFRFTSALNDIFLFQKLLFFEFLFGIPDTLVYSVSALLLGGIQLLIVFVRTVTYLEPKLFLLMMGLS
jgi:hypothetical protein